MNRITTALVVMVALGITPPVEARSEALSVSMPAGVEKTRLYLMAGDYRRALEACERAIQELPSVESYLQLTYVYQAIDAYLEQLSQDESWMAVEQLYLNLAYRHTEDLVDPPGGLARMAKEMIQTSVRQQSDLSAAMAVRLNEAESDRLWQEQAQWRKAHPATWWRSLPDSWIR
jgi:tetratricopeptide (TPR) repeat protein